ncbi:MAG: hypothetical protein H6797_00855 [Candidatus Nomurabacteria bacterium]|nr:MAG: hypothetical protein H6797_00855 [Candidatus Nomurabacteria bacterium]
MAKASTLSETFDSYNTLVWYRSNATNVAYTGGQLKLTPTTSYHYLDTFTGYDLTESHYQVEFVQNCNAGNHDSITTNFTVVVDGSNSFEFEIGGGPTGSVVMREQVAGVNSETTTTYDATNFRWLRLRESGGTIYWETSPDGSTWTIQRSKTSSLTLASTNVMLSCGRWTSETSPGNSYFDNLNPGSPTATLTDDFSTEDTIKWTGYEGNVASVVDGRLALSGATSDYYPPLESVSTYVFTGSYVACQFVENFPEGNGSYTLEFYVGSDTNNRIEFQINGGSLGISMKEKVAGVVSSSDLIYNPLRHKWLRMRESGGTVYWETSIDSATWVERWSKATTLNLNNVTIGFNGGYYGTETGSPVALFDNFNLIAGTNIGYDEPLPISLLTDEFTTLDGSKWYAPPEYSISAVDSVLSIPVVPNDYHYINTNDTWNLIGDSLLLELVQNANRGSSQYGTITTEIAVIVDATNRVQFMIGGGNGSEIKLREVVDGTPSDTTIIYDQTLHRWFRIRENSGAVYWETSKDGAVWNIQRSKSTTLDLSSVKVQFTVGSYENEVDPGTVLIDNVNLPNTALQAQIGWYVNSLPLGATDGGTIQPKNFFQQADWLWKPIPDNPVLDPMSALWGAELESGSHSVEVWDFADTIILPNQIDENTPRYTFTLLNYPDWGANPFDGYTIPVPLGTQIPPGSDGHLCVMDPTTGKVFSFWQTVYDQNTDSWSASWGGIADLNGDGRDYEGGATATNISRVAGVVLDNEVLAREIPHALFAASGSSGPDFRYPAQKSDGVNMAGVDNPVPQGIRVQLDPTINLAAIVGITPGELAVGRAMQKYGVYILEQSGGGPGFGCQLRFLWGDGYSGNYLETPLVYRQAGFQWDYFDMSHIPWAGNLRVLNSWDGS